MMFDAATLNALPNPWRLQGGRARDVVLSSRVRLARNYAGYPFPDRLDKEKAMQIWKFATDAVKDEDLLFLDLSRTPEPIKGALVASHFMSREQAASDRDRALLLKRDGRFAAMLCEEDHLRLQGFAPGLELEALWKEVSYYEKRFSEHAPYAYHKRWGYLTACPSNVGTGLRASVLLHLPGLRRSKQLGVLEELRALGLSVRGLYGEGTAPAGDLYQISNQRTLGQNEEEFIHLLSEATDRLIALERKARKRLFEHHTLAYSDGVWRAYGLLKNARLWEEKDAYQALSTLRFGIAMDVVPKLSLEDADEGFLQVQQAWNSLMLDDDIPARRRADALRTVMERS